MKDVAELRIDSKHKHAPETVVVGLMAILMSLATGWACLAAWSDLPANLHAVMPIVHHQAPDSPAASVLLMDSCQAAFENLYRSSHWTSDEIATYWERIQQVCNEKWGSTSRVLYLMVVPTIGREGEVAWWPWNLTITQDGRNHAITFGDSIVGLSKAFQGRIYSTMDGLIRLPDQVDVRRPFQIAYAITQVTIGPF